MKTKLKEIYEQKYKLLLIFPLALVVLALLLIGIQYAATGDFVHKGISLKGGSTITLTFVPTIPPAELETFLQGKFPQADFDIRTLSAAGQTIGIAIDSGAQQNEEITALLSIIREKVPLQEGQYSIEIVGSSLGESFFRQTFKALIIAFILMGMVVFIYFRTLIPSAAVIAAAFSDIVVTLAIFNLTGEKLSTSGVAAFLMLIGYSVDTDILLTSRVLKRQEGTVMERIYGAIKTGMTMTWTTLAAVIVTLFLVESEVIKQIMLILLIGLLVDMVMTWIQNVGMLRLYLERKKK